MQGSGRDPDRMGSCQSTRPEHTALGQQKRTGMSDVSALPPFSHACPGMPLLTNALPRSPEDRTPSRAQSKDLHVRNESDAEWHIE